jgi:hypothetical protein
MPLESWCCSEHPALPRRWRGMLASSATRSHRLSTQRTLALPRRPQARSNLTAQHTALPGMAAWHTRLHTCTVTQHGYTACEGSTSVLTPQANRALSDKAGMCECTMRLCTSHTKVCTQRGLHHAPGTRHDRSTQLLHARCAWSAVPALPVAQAWRSGRPCLLLITCRYFSTSVTDIKAHTLVALARGT